MDAELMCGVCLELFDCPLMLPCSHNFCKKCIAGILRSREQAQHYRHSSSRYVNSLDCPLCQRKIRIDSGIDSLPINRTLENIITIYKEGTCSASAQFNDLSWHTQSDIEETSCKLHSYPMSLYCLSCNLAVCPSCSCVSDKTSGVSHRCISIKEYTYQSQAKISEKLTEIKKKCSPLHDRIQLLEDVLTGIDDNEKKISKQLEIECGTLIACVRSRQEELNRQLHNDIVEIKRPVDEQLRKHRTLYNSVQDCLKKLSLVKGTKDQSLKIKLMQESEKQLNSLLCFDLAWFSSKESPMVDMPTWKLIKTDVEDALKKLDWQKIEVNKDKAPVAAANILDFGTEERTSKKEDLGFKNQKSGSPPPVSFVQMSKTPVSQVTTTSSSNQTSTAFTFTTSALPNPVFTPVQDSTVSSNNSGQNLGASSLSDQEEFKKSKQSATTVSSDTNIFTTLSTFSMPTGNSHSAFSAVTSCSNLVTVFDPSTSSYSTSAIGQGKLPGNFPIPKASDFIPKQLSNVSVQNKRGQYKKSEDVSKRLDGNKLISSSSVSEAESGLPVTCIKSTNTSMVSFSVAAAAEPQSNFAAANTSVISSSMDTGTASGPVHSVAMDTASSSVDTGNIMSSLPQKGKLDTCTSAFTVKAPAIGSTDNIQSSHVIKPCLFSQSENLPNISDLSVNVRRHSVDNFTPVISAGSHEGLARKPHVSDNLISSKFSKQYAFPKNTNLSINIPVSVNLPPNLGNTNSSNANIVIMSTSSFVTKPEICMAAFTKPSSGASLGNSESTSATSDSGSDMEISTNQAPAKSNIPFSNIPQSGNQNFPHISTRDFTTGQAQPQSPGKSVRRIIRAKKPKK